MFLDRPVGFRPGGEPGAARVLVRVIARREPLIRLERGDPEVFGRECGALRHRGVGVAESQDVAARDERIGRLVPKLGPAARIGDQPVPAAQWVDHPLRLRFPA